MLFFVLHCVMSRHFITEVLLPCKEGFGKQCNGQQPQIFQDVNLGCLHPVARVRSDDVGFNPSTQQIRCRLSSPR
jgi:hypothetical protein